ncbi:serine/threonine-protein kinase hal4 [Plectosphaerella cucumerina]|uniref:non-specific serine/threonine protein kinase n=1 Tax=Plectosphaerella cucumerina TaxID=40658 RepID=A0A8K0TFB4_9PEZI|nr:serine/threonine-protein kinase hal4 [Plectosphaerella cucumerina]
MSSVQGSRTGSVSSSKSLRSHDGSGKKSPGLTPQNGQSRANGNTPPSADGTSKPAERTSMKEKLTRMFSQRDTPRSTPSATANVSPRRNSFEDDAGNNTAPKSNAPATTDKVMEKSGGAVKPPKAEKKEVHRFALDAEAIGGHVHYLKSSRRQEKLSDMWRLLIGKKQQEVPADDENPNADLSLVSNWVDNVREEKRRQMAGDKKEGTGATTSLTEKYGKCQEVVGRGAFGIVRISHKKAENGADKLFAVKEFRRRPEETEKKYSKRLTAEFCISSSLRHQNVIHTLDLLKDAKGDFCEVMEFCAGGDLYTLVLSAGKLEVQEADCFFKQMMRGVEYLHEMGVAHRDLKPENLLLTTRGALKITDFGNGECFRMAWETDPHMVSGLCGSAPYIAPEEYVDKEFDARAVDVWACGVIYMAMRTGRHLWRVARKDQDEFYARYLEGRKDEEGYGPIESLHRARCRNVIYSILDPNPTRRITASQVLKSEWGREIKLCKAGEEGL